MTTRFQQKRLLSAALKYAATFAMCVLLASDAFGDGVAQIFTANSLPEATVAVIDPESGTSTGSGGEVRLDVGDVILFRVAFAPVPDKVNRGMMAYLTEYVPPNTEVVGVRMIDANGRTVRPRYPGLAIDGCSGGSQCNDFDNLPCNAGADNCSFAGGSIAGVHGDTGIFFANDNRVGKNPSNAFIAMDNGTLMNPEPDGLGAIKPLHDLAVNDAVYAHNEWDWIQVQAFGQKTNAAGTGGSGNGPFLYASPVAGPQTYYLYEATDTASGIELNDNVGPWQRIQYPGSQVGFGDCLDNSSAGINCTPDAPSTVERKILEAATANHCGAAGNQSCAGTDVTPAAPATATAVRFAFGEARTGKPLFAEIALRVTALPIDPVFGDHVNCAESFGSDLSIRGNNDKGDGLAWPVYLGSPGCVFLRLLLDVDADKDLALGSPIGYTLDVKNLRTLDEDNAVVRMVYDDARSSFVSATPAPDFGPRTCVDDSSKDCIGWNLGTLPPSAESQITASFNAGGGGQTSAIVAANYVSDSLPAPGFTTRDLTVIVGVALPEAELAPEQDPTAVSASPGSTYRLVGTLRNDSPTSVFTYDWVRLVLPTGWSVASSQITVGGVTYPCDDCGTNPDNPTFSLAQTFAVDESRTFEVELNVPMGTPTGLYPIDAQAWGSQPSFGGDFETYFPEIATIPVGAVRTQPPVLTCPVGSTSTEITGTSEADAAISLRFNLIERGTGAADGAGAWTVNNFGAFGGMYGGLEVTATAQVAGELESEPSVPCEVDPKRACSDGLDNDGDGRTDFPADPGCESPTDSDESDAPQCSDGIDNDGAGGTDWPNDPSCYGPDDVTEDGTPACSDGIDDDGDGDIDFPADSDCVDANGVSEATLRECQDRTNNDANALTDFNTDTSSFAISDPGCHTPFDPTEADLGFTPADVKARIAIVFDTSGSMNWNTCSDTFTGGDGSLDFPGSDVVCADLPASCAGTPALTGLCDNGLADDSRMFQVKAGMTNVVNSFGEVEFALMRFHQRATAFVPPDVNAGLASGGWQGGGAAPCDGGFAGADVLVSFSPDNQQSMLRWFDGDHNYGDVPPAALDFELRGSGTTPLGGALTDTLAYLQDVRTADPRGACRPYRVVLVTDGQETCGGDPVAAATALFGADIPVTVIAFATNDPGVTTALNNIAIAGSDPAAPRNAIAASDEAAVSAAFGQIISETILFELCDYADNDCDLLEDEDFPDRDAACNNGQLGACLRTGTMICTADGLGTECDAPDGSASSMAETCNLIDDDCDGKVDEAPAAPCNCLGQEICNGIDDDCDNAIDEAPVSGVGQTCGLTIGECTAGTVQCVDPDSNPATVNSVLDCTGGVGPAPEDQCDSLDNDCDTRVDEDFGESCYSFASGCTDTGGGVFTCNGICRAGNRECVSGVPGACVGDVGPDASEVCNGVDDDCDGAIDEDWKPDGNGNTLGATCSNGLIGACEATGTYTCDPTDNTAPLICTAPIVSPGAEICNSVDDDCDGTVDEGDGTTPAPPDGLSPPIGNACGGAGDCTPGILQCTDHDSNPATPNEITCVGQTGGSEEVCNGADDDCDDEVDEAVAGVGVECYPDGVAGCTGDAVNGFVCDGVCQPGSTICTPPAIVCDGHIGPAATDPCDGLDNDCDGTVDEGATCSGADETCVAGECAFPCKNTEFPCPFGFRCKSLEDTECSTPPCRFCVDDPCATKECPDGFSCDPDTAECIDLCDGIECRDGETCFAGRCFDCFDAGFGCDDCETCVANAEGVGTCTVDTCCGVTCDADEFCREGTCFAVTCDPECAADERCVDGACVSDPCAGVQCFGGQTCDPTTGECGTDACDGVDCNQGRVCRPSDGSCIDDPCAQTTCPDRTQCVVSFEGTSRCEAVATDRDFVHAGGGCRSGRDQGSALLLFMLGLLAGRRRRSKRRACQS